MTPAEAWARVRANPDDGDAWVALVALPLGMQHRQRVVQRFEDDARSQSKVNLTRRARLGTLPDLPHDGQVVKYFGTCVVNASLSILDDENQLTAEAAAPEPRVDDEPELDPATLEQLESLFHSALRIRQPRFRGHLELAWRQVKRLHTEPLTLDQVLVETEGIAPGDEVELDAAAARAYKRHERLRAALQLTLSRKRASFDEETHDNIRVAIGLLRRRRPLEER